MEPAVQARELGGGGGGGEPMERFIVQLGLLMGFTAVLAVLLHFAKQSTIVSYILVGLIMKQIFTELDVVVDTTVMDHFSHIGIIFLLFMAGLEVDIAACIERAKVVSIVGFGQIGINTVMGMVVGMAIVPDMLNGGMGIVYFGLCCTFSSTIVVLGMLKRKKQLESLHGQLCLGMLVFQDVTAVLALAVLNAAAEEGEWEECGDAAGNATKTARMLGGGGGGGSDKSLGESLAMLGIWLVVFSILQFLSAKFLLQPLFRELAHSSELMFLGTLGYALLSAGVADAVGFSAEIAAFLAGVSMTVLPYKLEIEDKVESIKNLGVVTFFITLGMDLELNIKIGYYLASLITAVVILTCTMGILIILGYLARMKARPTFMIGGIVNQISEFSLILATLCVGRGVFCKNVLTILAIACVATIVLSGIGHEKLDSLWMSHGKKYLAFLDARAVTVHATAEGIDLKDHVVCFGVNKLTHMIAKYAKEKLGKTHILVVDIDADAINSLQDDPICKTMYADMFDPGTWEKANLVGARLVVSCLEAAHEAELAMGRHMHENNSKAFYITTTEDDREAIELYEEGHSAFVVHTEELATMKLQELLATGDLKNLKAIGDTHKAKLGHGHGHGGKAAVHPAPAADAK